MGSSEGSENSKKDSQEGSGSSQDVYSNSQ